MGTPNWAKLVASGRAKDVGVPWSDKELAALAAGVTPDMVRRGATTHKEAEKFAAGDTKALEKEGQLPVEAMNRAQLATRARELDVAFSPETPASVLRDLVRKAEEVDGGASNEDESNEDESNEDESNEDESNEEAEPKPAPARKRARAKKAANK